MRKTIIKKHFAKLIITAILFSQNGAIFPAFSQDRFLKNTVQASGTVDTVLSINNSFETGQSDACDRNKLHRLKESKSLPDQEGLKIYPAPEGEKASDYYKVKVNGKNVHVYEARVSKEPINLAWPQPRQRPLEQTELSGFAYWDMSEPVKIEIESISKNISNVMVRPLSLKIAPTINDNKIFFTLTNPSNFVVEVNDFHNALHLFANPIETDIPDINDPSVTCFGPGVHYPGYMALNSNETVYIAGGAVVHGYIHIKNASNVTVRGRGILDTSTYTDFPTWTNNSFYILKSEGIRIEGFIKRDPPNWAFRMVYSTNILVDNVKIIGAWRYNTDGFGVFECNDTTIRNTFVRSFDDSILFKSEYDGHLSTFPAYKVKRNFLVENCTIWTDWGYSLGVAHEVSAGPVSGIVFKNCDILHNMASNQALQVNPRKGGYVNGVEFRNIRVEDAQTGLIGVYNHADNILFQNISVLNGPSPTSGIMGANAGRQVRDITIQNLVIHGRKILNAAQGNFRIGPFAQNIQFLP